MITRVLRVLFTLILGATGVYLMYGLAKMVNIIWLREFLVEPWKLPVAYIVSGILFALIGFFIAPLLIRLLSRIAKWLEGLLTSMPMADLLGACLGIIVGLLIATLFQNSLSSIPFIGPALSVIISLLLGYVGMVIGMKRKEDLWNLGAFFSRMKEKSDKAEKTEKAKESKANKNKKEAEIFYKVLDTSVIIDGRVADIVKTGFLDGVLLVPGFVLEELRHIADSSDLLKRNRGRRGLDILNNISKEELIKVEVYEKDFEDVAEVDSKLVRLAQTLDCPILTNDYNLNKVAELQGVKVLNINELANALKPVVLPGEEMFVQVMKEGKEASQGVAYLDDGTMIVIDGGRKYIGQELSVLVTTVLQTAAGRMIFAKPKSIFEKSFEGFSHHEANAL